jgi:hypothetical protein
MLMQPTPRATLPTLLALLLGFGLMQMGNTLQGTLLSVRGGIEDFSPAQIGAVGAGFWVGVPKRRAYSGVSGSWSGRLDRAAPAPAGNGSDSVDSGSRPDRFCFAGLFIVVESWLNSAATDETRGQIMSVYAMTGLLAGIVGQLLLPTTDPAGFRPFCIIAIIIAFALVPIALTRAVAPAHDGGAPGSASGGSIGSRRSDSWPPSCAGVTTSAFFTLGPILAQRRGLDIGGVAAFMASGRRLGLYLGVLRCRLCSKGCRSRSLQRRLSWPFSGCIG